jgi:tryptophan synthase beta chain
MPDDILNIHDRPRRKGPFGDFGGRFVSETLMPLILELEAQYENAKTDPELLGEMNDLWTNYVGRPADVFRRAADRASGRRQDLLQARRAQSHRRAQDQQLLGQILLAKRMGKTRIIAETGAGQHGVATATVCAVRLPVRSLHGRHRRGAAGAQRVPHEAAGRQGASR